MTCGNVHHVLHRAYPAGAIGSRADPLRTGMSCSPYPPLAEPCDEAVEPPQYRDGQAAWTERRYGRSRTIRRLEAICMGVRDGGQEHGKLGRRRRQVGNRYGWRTGVETGNRREKRGGRRRGGKVRGGRNGQSRKVHVRSAYDGASMTDGMECKHPIRRWSFQISRGRCYRRKSASEMALRYFFRGRKSEIRPAHGIYEHLDSTKEN